MKNLGIVIFILFIFLACNRQNTKQTADAKHKTAIHFDSTNNTNDFYDNAETRSFEIPTIQITGDVKKDTVINPGSLPLRSIIVKEAIISGDTSKFIGAYRYDGYSLYDILNYAKIDKKNKKFNPIIDMFVLITNEKGDSAIFSWGEIYYSIHRHEIIIATKVMRIVPSKTKDLWPLPTETKIVAGADLLTERNISNPTKIQFIAAPKNADESKKGTNLKSEKIEIKNQNTVICTITDFIKDLDKLTYPCIFYGRGRGIHGIKKFNGHELDKVLAQYFAVTKSNLRNGYFIISANDDYHGVFTFSEIFNRNDQSSFLLTQCPMNVDGWKFSLYPAPDFFSDRAIKAITEINYMYAK